MGFYEFLIFVQMAPKLEMCTLNKNERTRSGREGATDEKLNSYKIMIVKIRDFSMLLSFSTGGFLKNQLSLNRLR